MLFFKDGFKLAREKVLYRQDGQDLTNYVGSEGKEWWLDFEQKWENMTILTFEPITYTKEQEVRLLEVQKYFKEERYLGELEDYVLNGKYPKDLFSPLRDLQAKRAEDFLLTYAMDLEYRLCMQELGMNEGGETA